MRRSIRRPVANRWRLFAAAEAFRVQLRMLWHDAAGGR
jgi:hypothetical protein